MKELSSRARYLIALAKREDDPTLADQDRVGHSLAKQLGVGVLATAMGVTASGSAVKSTLSAVWGKLLLMTALGAGAALFMGQSTPEALRVRPALAQPDQLQTSANHRNTQSFLQPISEASATMNGAAAIGERLSDTSPELSRMPAATQIKNGNHSVGLTQRRVSVATDQSGAAAKAAIDPLLAETAALRDAQRAMRSGDAARAIALVDAQDRLYPMGSLKQERTATRIFALCAMGQAAQAASLARAFERRWPHSPMLTRVQNSCGSE